jgi:hypothetical protein
VAQGQVLEGQLAMTAEQEGEEPKQVEQESNHRAEIVAGSGPTDQPLGQRTGFWRRTPFDQAEASYSEIMEDWLGTRCCEDSERVDDAG